MRVVLVAAFALALAGCGNGSEVPGFEGLAEQVGRHRVGSDADQWIEMRNMSGEWERIGLVFGYLDDRDECSKAIAGLKDANYAREYRCMPAN